jgi:hypothetical protein
MSLSDRLRVAPRYPSNIGGCSTCQFIASLSEEDRAAVFEWVDVRKCSRAALYRICRLEFPELNIGLSAFTNHWSNCHVPS